MKASLLFLLMLTCVLPLAAQEASPVSPPGVVHVVTYLDLLPAQASDGRALLIGAVKEQRAHRGCGSVELVQEQNRPNHFVLVETWNDLTALESYRATREYLAFRAALQPALGSPLDERRGSQIAP